MVRIITRLNIGGPSRHVLTLTERLPAFGFASDLISGAVGPREGAIGSAHLCSHVVVSTLHRQLNPLADFRASLALYNLIRSKRPLIVHTHQAKAGTLGRVVARLAGVPLVIHTFHGHVLEGYFAKPVAKLFVEVERTLAHHTDVLIAVSSVIRDELLELGIGRPEQWRVVPLGLELDHLIHNQLDQTEARQKLRLPLEGPFVGIVGRLAPIKDVSTFLKACALVAKEQPQATFVIAGDGPLRYQIEEEGHNLLGERVRFLGWVAELPPLYAALDTVVLTSRNEGTPVALIEASAAGRPVIGTNVGAVSDVVQEGKTGFLVRAGDAETVADRILELLGNASLRAKMGLAGRNHVQDRYSANRLVHDMASLYTSLLSKDPRPPK